MKAISIRIDDIIYDLIKKNAEINKKTISDFIRFVFAKELLSCSFIVLSEEERAFFSYIILNYSRVQSKQFKEVKCAFVNLKNSLLRFIVKGNSSKRVFEILQNEKKRIDLCLSKEEMRELKKIKLKDIKKICDMVAEAKTKSLKDSEILAVGFDVFRSHNIKNMRIEVLKEIEEEDKKITKHMR